MFEEAWHVPLQDEPGLRISNMLDAAIEGTYKGIYIQGEDIVQSDPNTQHMTAGLTAMECVVVQDLFLNETASYAHVFFPGSSFLEKDGTFTNAERRISRVRKAIPPMAGLADWEITMKLSEALGYPMHYKHPSEIMDEIARLTPTFAGVSLRKDRRAGQRAVALQRQGSRRHAHHAHRRIRARQGPLHDHRVRAHRRAHHRPLPADSDHRPHPDAIQRRRADRSHGKQRLASRRHARNSSLRTRRIAAFEKAICVSLASRAGETSLHARISERMQPGVVYTTFHHGFTGANVVTTEFEDWATGCPEYKVTAVQVTLAKKMSEWQKHYLETRQPDHADLDGRGRRLGLVVTTMESDRMVHRANQIALFFAGYPHDEAVAGVADHFKKFWERRMRDQIIAYVAQAARDCTNWRSKRSSACNSVRTRFYWTAACRILIGWKAEQ